MAVPLDQLDLDRELVLTDVHRVEHSSPLIILEAYYVELHIHLLINVRDVCYTRRVLDLIQPSAVEPVVEVMELVCLIILSNGLDCREQRVLKASLLPVLHVEDATFQLEEERHLYVCAARHHGIVLSELQLDARHARRVQE